MEFVRKEDGPGIGRPPQDGLVVVVPGKDAVAVGFEQSLGSQVAPDGEQALRGGQINGREAQIRWVCAEPEQGRHPLPLRGIRLGQDWLEDGICVQYCFQRFCSDEEIPDVRCLSGNFSEPSFGFRESFQERPIVPVWCEQQTVGFGVFGHEFIERDRKSVV